MVLGLGSRSKKERGSAVSQLVQLELHLHEIKPWLGLANPSKMSTLVALRWDRGGRLIGRSRNVSSATTGCPEVEKLSFGESLRIAEAPNREVLKRTKKLYPDLGEPLIFTLLDTDDLTGKPLARAALDLSSFASITEPKLVAVPFTISKRVVKGAIFYLHITVQKYQDEKASGPTASESLGNSGRKSDAPSPPPLDEDTQQRLVAALLSDSEDSRKCEGEEIGLFTDDDEETMKDFDSSIVPQDLSSSQGNGGFRPPEQSAGPTAVDASAGIGTQGASIFVMQPRAEKHPENVEENVSRRDVASPFKAAAIAAAAAYSKRYSFLPRHRDSFVNDSDKSSSDLDSAREDEFPSQFSKTAQSPSLWKGSSNTVDYLQVNTSSAGVANTLLNTSLEKGTKEESQKKNKGQIITNDAGNMPVVEDKLNSQYLLSTSSVVRTMQEVKITTEERMKFVQKGESNGRVETIMPASAVLNSSYPSNESNVKFMGSRSGSEASLNTETALQKSFSNKNDIRQKVERTPSKSLMNSERDAMLRTQAKPSREHKSKLPVKTSFRNGGQQKSLLSKSPDPTKGRTNQSPAKDSKASRAMMQDGKAMVFKSPDRQNKTIYNKEIEESKEKSLNAEKKGDSVPSKVQQIEIEVQKLKEELRDVAAVEAALYSTIAEHGSSSMKLHAPARRLARMYFYSCKHSSPERRASCARTTMSGLVLTARACGNDVARLTFWWSNIAVLREILENHSKAFPVVPKAGMYTRPDSSNKERKLFYQKQRNPSVGHACEDWRELSTFITALERLESWIFTKVVESIWWQVLTPQMQQPEKHASLKIDDNGADIRPNYGKHEKKQLITQELEDAQQGNVSLGIWKKAFLVAYGRLCPVRVLGVQCGCLPVLNRLVLEACVGRLDVAMFNAILRDDDVPSDPVSDPISHARVLPIPNGSLSFGHGAQLKNVVATLSSFISNLTKRAGDVTNEGISDDDEHNIFVFPYLKAMGGLLMLPKDMLKDKSLRKEVCPTLGLSLIAKILSKFQPDDFSSEPIKPELLDTINAEVAAEREDMDDCGSTVRIAFSPSVVYTPQSSMVRHWIGDLSCTDSPLSRSSSSILRKGHTSDDEIDELEAPISWLWENTVGSNGHNRSISVPSGTVTSPKDGGGICRFMLLREVWSSS